MVSPTLRRPEVTCRYNIGTSKVPHLLQMDLSDIENVPRVCTPYFIDILATSPIQQ